MSSTGLSLHELTPVTLSGNEQARGLINATRPGWWLFSAPVDLAVFLGSAVVALTALAMGAYAGLLREGTPDWAWIPAVLLIDVAHVYATAFRVYLDPEEVRSRPWLYSLVPLFGFVIGVALYSEGELIFWRALAYVAVFHFIRQQYGWVALYRARVGEQGALGRYLDVATIYLATLYPLIYWHAHLPRRFWWFFKNDFTAMPPILERIVEPIYWSVLALYACRSVYLWLILRKPNPGKDIVVITTVACWYLGIVAFNSDYAFTVTNVIIHGVPYLALVYWYCYVLPSPRERPRSKFRGLVIFLATLWVVAYIEEMFWDRGVWHERSWFFGSPWDVGQAKTLLVPLLALPQMTHYILDGFIWRRRTNPRFSVMVGEGEGQADFLGPMS